MQIPAKLLRKCLLRRDMPQVTPMLQLFRATPVLEILRDMKVHFIIKNYTISFTMVVESVICRPVGYFAETLKGLQG